MTTASVGPIGVYDSGFGGLTVLRALRQVLPTADLVYLGDAGRAPYGGRDTHTILDFAEQCVEHLFDRGCRVVLVACHTVSCVGLRHLQHRYAPLPGAGQHRRVLGVTIPAAEAAVALSRGQIGIIGTSRTVASGTFPVEIAKISNARVTQVAAPLLAALVEEGFAGSEIARLAVEHYLQGLRHVDTLLLGCTHYPLLLGTFRAALGPGVQVLDPGPEVARRWVAWSQRHPGFWSPGTGQTQFLSTGDPAVFSRLGAAFWGGSVGEVQHVSAEAGRLLPGDGPRIPVGQVVRR